MLNVCSSISGYGKDYAKRNQTDFLFIMSQSNHCCLSRNACGYEYKIRKTRDITMAFYSIYCCRLFHGLLPIAYVSGFYVMTNIDFSPFVLQADHPANEAAICNPAFATDAAFWVLDGLFDDWFSSSLLVKNDRTTAAVWRWLRICAGAA